MASPTISLMLLLVFSNLLHLRHQLNAKEHDRFVIKEMETDCRRLMCGQKSRCIYRKNWCRSPPCPSMVFCRDDDDGDDEEEEEGERNREYTIARMPTSCDKVRCSRSYRCVTRYVRDQRTGLYTNINAQCVVNDFSHQPPATCAGFKCPLSNLACILREPKCRGYPCRILQACIPEEEVEKLQAQCSRMNCSAPDNCFIKKPHDCEVKGCNHTVACLHSHGDKPLHEYCRGFICPRGANCEPIYKHCYPLDAAGLMIKSCKPRPGCTAKFGNPGAVASAIPNGRGERLLDHFTNSSDSLS